MGQGSGEIGSSDRLDDREIDRSFVVDSGVEGTVTDEGDTDPAEIRAEIEQTRSSMSQTIDEITERLSPQNLKEQVKDQVMEQVQEVKDTVYDATVGRAEDMVRYAGDTVNEARYGLVETIRQNPIPAALAGLSLGWLWMNRRSAPQSRQYDRRERYWDEGRGRSYGGQYEDRGYYTEYRDYGGYRDRGYQGSGGDYVERARDTAGNVAGQARNTVSSAVSSAQGTLSNAASSAQDTVSSVASTATETAGNLASSATETVGQVAGAVQETASQVVDRAQYGYNRLEDRFSSQVNENPLVVGAIALALGAAAGLALPGTQRENELMGETRDTLVERAQEVASETMGKVQNVAGQVAGQAQETASQAAQQAGLTS